MPDYPMFKLVSDLYDVVPEVLGKTGKVRRRVGRRGGMTRWAQKRRQEAGGPEEGWC
jgi:hypothetical protein